MKLLEYEAKQMLRTVGVAVPDGRVVHDADAAPMLPCVLKVQVPVGGRGKAGGIRVVRSEDEYEDALGELAKLDIKGHTPSAIYAEELIDIERELYLAVIINRESADIELMAHPSGGVEVEQHDPDSFLRISLSANSMDAVGQTVADYFDLPEIAFVLSDLIENLEKAFTASDMTLLEINPLVLSRDGLVVAADAKIELDDAAAYRHPEWKFEAESLDANFVALDPIGTVATIANGAGLAMATVDAVTARGYQAANFLDIGGSATTEQITSSLGRIMDFEHVEAIVINIFGGIVRCDTVAQAILEARRSIADLPRLVIRLSGNRSDEARDVLAGESLVLYDSLDAALDSIGAKS